MCFRFGISKIGLLLKQHSNEFLKIQKKEEITH